MTDGRGGRALAALAVAVAVALASTHPAGASHRFDDLPDTSPFHDDIAWADDTGIVTGYADGTFAPAAPVSRQAAAAVLHRWWTALGRPDPAPLADPGFTDVALTHTFHADIAWAAALGITTGTPDGRFDPTAPVSRQAMAAFEHRMAGALGHVDPAPLVDPGFTDVPGTHPFHTDIAWAAALGITRGHADGGFHPTQPVSRQSAAALLHNQWDALTTVVDQTTDADDAAIGDDRCAATPEGTDCTLRAAISEANATPGHQRIAFADGVAVVSLTVDGFDDDLNAQGDLDVTDDLTIHAAGTTIDGSALASDYGWCANDDPFGVHPCRTDLTDRAVHVHGDPLVSIHHLVVTGSRTGELGSALLVDGGHVTLDEVEITGNGTYHDAGVVGLDGGTLRLRRSTITDNAAPCTSVNSFCTTSTS